MNLNLFPHAESMDSASFMLANDSQQHDIQHAYYYLQVNDTVCNTRDSGNEDISGDDLPLAMITVHNQLHPCLLEHVQSACLQIILWNF